MFLCFENENYDEKFTIYAKSFSLEDMKEAYIAFVFNLTGCVCNVNITIIKSRGTTKEINIEMFMHNNITNSVFLVSSARI